MKPAATVRTMSSVEAKVGTRERMRLRAARKRPSRMPASQRPELSVCARGSRIPFSLAQRSRVSFQSAAKPFRSVARAKITITISITSAAGSRMASLRKCLTVVNRARKNQAGGEERQDGGQAGDGGEQAREGAEDQADGRMVSVSLLENVRFLRYFPT